MVRLQKLNNAPWDGWCGHRPFKAVRWGQNPYGVPRLINNSESPHTIEGLHMDKTTKEISKAYIWEKTNA